MNVLPAQHLRTSQRLTPLTHGTYRAEMQTIRAVQTSRAVSARKSVKCDASKPQVKTLPRRELLTTGAAFAAALLGAGAARAAGESSATRAITAVTRPQQLKKKEDNRAALKEQVQKVRAGEADPKSIP